MYINASPAIDLAWVNVCFAETWVFFALQSKTAVNSDFSFSETYSDPLFIANAYICHKDQADIVARLAATRDHARML